METEREKLEAAGVWDGMRPETKDMLTDLSESQKTEGGEFRVLGEGLLYTTVCSSLGQDEVEARMARRPSGTRAGWVFSDEPFDDDSPNPVACNEHPETHKHYLFAC